MVRFIGITFVAFLTAGFVQAREDTAPISADSPGLERVEGARFRETYADAGVDFSRYKTLYPGDMYFEYRDVGPAGQIDSSDLSNPGNSLFGISESDRVKFEEIVTEAFLKELGKDKNFTLVDHVDENTLVMRAGVVDVISRKPPESVGITEVYLATLGEATLVMEFLDGTSGEVIAKISERGRMGSLTEQIDAFTLPANRATVWYQVRRWATYAARRLHDELDSAIGEGAF